MHLPEMKSADDLEVALSGRRRYLQRELDLELTTQLRNAIRKRNVYRYWIKEGPGDMSDVVIARVVPEVAKAWIDDGRDEGSRFHGPKWDTWHIPEFSGFRDWISCGERFVIGDTVRWEEGLLTSSEPRRWFGHGELVAEVVDEDREEGAVWLYLIEAVVLHGPGKGLPVECPKAGSVMKRTRKKIALYGAGRLLCVDETARRERLRALDLEG